MDILTNEQMSRTLHSMLEGKRYWLQNFSSGKSKRPDHEIEQKREEFACLRQAYQAYTAAANRSDPPLGVTRS